MFSSSRKFLVIFLAMLQLIAPLVHAHASQKTSIAGLHVPGLEGYAADHVALMSEAASYYASAEGIIVGIDAGIKQHQDKPLADPDHSYYLPQQAVVFKTAISPFDCNFSPQSPPFVAQLFSPSHSPRAPPVR